MGLYQDLSDYLQKGRDKTRRPYEKANTYLIKQENGVIRLLLHEHPIVSIGTDDNIVLNSCGYKTVTTKDRMNMLLREVDLFLFQEKGFWYVSRGDIWDTKKAFLFFDGMEIPKDLKPSPKAAREKDRIKYLKKLIDLYVKKLKGMIADKVLDLPGPGDCWHCLGMFGEGDNGHIMSHLQEGYVVPSLVHNALKDAGYNCGFLWSCYNQWRNESKEHGRDAFIDTAVRATRRYLRRQLGLAG